MAIHVRKVYSFNTFTLYTYINSPTNGHINTKETREKEVDRYLQLTEIWSKLFVQLLQLFTTLFLHQEKVYLSNPENFDPNPN